MKARAVPGWNRETIGAAILTAAVVLAQMAALLFTFLGFNGWPQGPSFAEPAERPVIFRGFRPRREVMPPVMDKYSMDAARREINLLRNIGQLDQMRLSKIEWAERWGVSSSIGWRWLQKFEAEGLIECVPTGTGKEHHIRARASGNELRT